MQSRRNTSGWTSLRPLADGISTRRRPRFSDSNISGNENAEPTTTTRVTRLTRWDEKKKKKTKNTRCGNCYRLPGVSEGSTRNTTFMWRNASNSRVPPSTAWWQIGILWLCGKKHSPTRVLFSAPSYTRVPIRLCVTRIFFHAFSRRRVFLCVVIDCERVRTTGSEIIFEHLRGHCTRTRALGCCRRRRLYSRGYSATGQTRWKETPKGYVCTVYLYKTTGIRLRLSVE